MFWICLIVGVAALATLLPYLVRGTELVRLRNALLLRSGAADCADWVPGEEPADFKLEHQPPSQRFAVAVSRLGLDAAASDWDKALLIGRHLLASVKPDQGVPIQGDLDETHARIVERGDGYCGDFVDAFAALAIAAGLHVRTWAFSFDGFGGHGHTISEVWDDSAGRWRAIDVFNNYFFADDRGEPMSASEFRAVLASGADYRFVPVADGIRPGFIHEEVGRAYYARGAGQWYLWWGSNVFSYDRDPLVARAGAVSQKLAQLAAIARGVHPQVCVLETAANAHLYQRMRRLRVRIIVACSVSAAAFGAALVLWMSGSATPAALAEDALMERSA